MSFMTDLGQVAGGAVKQYNEMTDQEMVNRRVKIEEQRAKREEDEAKRVNEKRAAISALGEVAHQPVGGYASSTSIEQLQKQNPNQPIINDEDGQLTPFGTSIMASVTSGSGFSYKPEDQAVIDSLGAYAKSASTPKGVTAPGEAPPSNPLANIKIMGSRVVNSNYNPDAAQSTDDRKMWLKDYKNALINVAKFSDNADDILRVDKMVRAKEFDDHANQFWDIKRDMALGNDKGAVEKLNSLMPDLMPGVQVGSLVRDKDGQLVGVNDKSGKQLPVNMQELSNLFASDDPMKVIELGYKGRDTRSREVTAQAEVIKAGAWATDAKTKQEENPSKIAYNEAHTANLTADTKSKIDERQAKKEDRETNTFNTQVYRSLGLPKDPKDWSTQQHDSANTIIPVAESLWDYNKSQGKNVTGSQAADAANGLRGDLPVDKNGKKIKDGQRVPRYQGYPDPENKDRAIIKDINTGRFIMYAPIPAGSQQNSATPVDSAPAKAPAKSGITPQKPSALSNTTPASGIDNTRYMRSKISRTSGIDRYNTNSDGYNYTPSGRGLTKAQWAESDAQKTK